MLLWPGWQVEVSCLGLASWVVLGLVLLFSLLFLTVYYAIILTTKGRVPARDDFWSAWPRLEGLRCAHVASSPAPATLK